MNDKSSRWTDKNKRAKSDSRDPKTPAARSETTTSSPDVLVAFSQQPAMFGESPGYDPYDHNPGPGCPAVCR